MQTVAAIDAYITEYNELLDKVQDDKLPRACLEPFHYDGRKKIIDKNDDIEDNDTKNDNNNNNNIEKEDSLDNEINRFYRLSTTTKPSITTKSKGIKRALDTNDQPPPKRAKHGSNKVCTVYPELFCFSVLF